MALRRQIVPVDLSAGIDAGGTDAKIVRGKLLKCENGRFKRRGAVAKRLGTASSGTATSSTIVGRFEDKCIAYGTDDLYEFDASNAPAAVGSADLQQCQFDVYPKYSRANTRYQQVMRCNSNGEVVALNFATAWNTTGPVLQQNSLAYIQSKKATNGTRQTLEISGTLHTGTPAITDTYISAINHADFGSGDFRVYYIKHTYSAGYTGSIQYRDVSSSSIGSESAQTLSTAPLSSSNAFEASSNDTGSPYCLDVYSDGSICLLAYATSTTDVTLVSVASNGSENWAVSYTHSTEVGPFCIVPITYSGTTYYALVSSNFRRSSGATMNVNVYDSSGTGVFTGGTHTFAWASSSNTTCQQIAGCQTDTDVATVFFNTCNDSGAYQYSVLANAFSLSGTPNSGSVTWGYAGPGISSWCANGYVLAARPMKNTTSNTAHLLLEGPVFHELPDQTAAADSTVVAKDVSTQHSWYVAKFNIGNDGSSGSPFTTIVGKGPYGLNGTFVIQSDRDATDKGRADAHYAMRGLIDLSETSGRGIGAALPRNDDTLDGTSHNFPVKYYFSEASAGAGYVDIDLSSTNKVRPVFGNGVTYIPNSCPYEFDGDNVVEQGFLAYPEMIGAVLTASDGGAWGKTGLVTFYVIYEWTDATGRIHQSAPSLPYTCSIAATADSVLIYCLPYPHFGRKQGVRAALYRTDINEDAPYRIETIDATDNDGNTLVFTKVLGDEVTTVDVGDKAYAKGDVLYTYSGTIENIGPDPHYISEVYQSRYVHIPHKDRKTTLLYGQQYIGGRGTEHSPLLSKKIPADGGDITGLGVMDEKLAIFKTDQCYIMSGRGVGRTGAGNDFDEPRLVSSSVGCTDHRTIAMIPQGLLFLSRHGIYLLGRDENLQFIGEEVRYFTDTYTYTGLAVDNVNHVAIFTSASGPALCYDHMYQRWSTMTGAFDSMSSIAAFSDRVALINSSGAVTISDDTSSNFLDGSTSYNLTLETAWMAPSGPLQYQRVYSGRLLMTNISDHKIRIKTAYNYEPHWVDEQEFDSSSLVQWDDSAHFGSMSDSAKVDNAYVLDFGIGRTKCEAVRFQISIEDPAGASAAEAVTIVGMSLEVGMKPGLFDGGHIMRKV